ncbi:hypothetical protein J2S30_000025 [Herbaspirillum rubrisubalbicans]|uniref:Endonuclease/exonuclease/phosphatase family protein n=1 Tax=Herbaspirillum rubrisubalbicans Os34 TaxID=1235827 RepID=A0A6M3ZQ04_9BURK|nr:endonuclease/exonuclease/phosphatase family protein [Herbaspirillum rubrisubalbicans]MCP1571646.1 hypothetical protein [Herbaspirillum rubrisubalbicans]NQE51357.1 hypothetical protein [Herbaspirillum rubrisubalbicans]QJQ00353.1 endonuclease/exonuclease/phosphatase family protein [Herbaspirillum rubrisubalbicans Os34]
MKLAFVWWNTSLSRAAAPNRSTTLERSIAADLLALMCHDIRPDAICLGEISTEDIARLQDVWAAHGYSLIDGIRPVGRTSFDTCILFRTDTLIALDNKDLVAQKGQRYFKVAQRFDFGVCDNETIIHLFVSHWPSRIHTSEDHPHRDFLGIRLRDAVKETRFEENQQHVIILGDFNDEPFDAALSDHLMATRDRALAAKKSHLLYNPFWRLLGCSTPYRQTSQERSPHSGSCYYRGGESARWKTFDQIIFSPSFLGKTSWHLCEELVQILDVPFFTDIVRRAKHSFDHLPVIGVVEKA